MGQRLRRPPAAMSQFHLVHTFVGDLEQGIGVISVGGHKESGTGSEGGLEGLEEYMSKTAVQVHI